MDLKVDNDGDVVIENGDFVLVTGIEAVAQDIACELRRWLGEDHFDQSGGMPYRQIIFERGTTVGAVAFIMEQKIRAREFVQDVLELNVTADRTTGKASITGRVRALDQEVPIDLQVSQS